MDSTINEKAKLDALEKLVIELTLIAISTANIQHHHKARLDQLLGDLQYAGIEPPNGGLLVPINPEKERGILTLHNTMTPEEQNAFNQRLTEQKQEGSGTKCALCHEPFKNLTEEMAAPSTPIGIMHYACHAKYLDSMGFLE